RPVQIRRKQEANDVAVASRFYDNRSAPEVLLNVLSLGCPAPPRPIAAHRAATVRKIATRAFAGFVLQSIPGMRIWLSKNSEVPLREQIITQITLGIISHDLQPNQKLPSTRELSHRLQVHPNTVSAAYRDLEQRGWVEIRKGSGVYVRALSEKKQLDA